MRERSLYLPLSSDKVFLSIFKVLLAFVEFSAICNEIRYDFFYLHLLYPICSKNFIELLTKIKVTLENAKLQVHQRLPLHLSSSLIKLQNQAQRVCQSSFGPSIDPFSTFATFAKKSLSEDIYLHLCTSNYLGCDSTTSGFRTFKYISSICIAPQYRILSEKIKKSMSNTLTSILKTFFFSYRKPSIAI